MTLSLYIIVMVTLVTSIAGSVFALRRISASNDISFEQSKRNHPAGKGLRNEEDILNDIKR